MEVAFSLVEIIIGFISLLGVICGFFWGLIHRYRSEQLQVVSEIRQETSAAVNKAVANINQLSTKIDQIASDTHVALANYTSEIQHNHKLNKEESAQIRSDFAHTVNAVRDLVASTTHRLDQLFLVFAKSKLGGSE